MAVQLVINIADDDDDVDASDDERTVAADNSYANDASYANEGSASANQEAVHSEAVNLQRNAGLHDYVNVSLFRRVQ